ncbi:MAG: hypothetical protein M3467_00420 [Actinomycetota bacterium]|nr:hypothetical protein [Actinomycetota bacterium]
MRFSVDPWDPGYGAAMDAEAMEPSTAAVDVNVEVPAAQWAPLSPNGVVAPERVRFIDGVRRIDARVWITRADGTVRPGIAASYAAGVVCCQDAAKVERCEVRRGLFCSDPDAEAIRTRSGEYTPGLADGDGIDVLTAALQQSMRSLERLVAASVDDAQLTVVDGPLSRPSVPGAIGYVKTHQRSYLPAELTSVVEGLAVGERTPLFLTTTKETRYSWYARLPGERGHAWSGVVRGEAPDELAVTDAAALADMATATLPTYASMAHKDPRAPQNLYPVAELERTLRRHLGDPALLYRGLRLAAAPSEEPRPSCD